MEKKIKQWLEAGFIDEPTAAKLLSDIKQDKERSRKTKINVTIYTIAIVFLGLGVISFIAANDWILELLNSSDILKILSMLTVTLLSLWGGYKLAYENKKFPKLGNALILLSCFLIGGTYALLGQIYHINANNSGIMFIWLLSILPIAYLFKNFGANVISIVLYLFTIPMFYAELGIDKNETWTIFIPILTGLTLYSIGNLPTILNKYPKFSLSYKIIGSLPIYVTLLILACSVENSYQLTSPYYILPLVLLIGLNFANYMFQKPATKLLSIETTSIITILLTLLLIIVLPEISVCATIIFVNITLIAMIIFGFNYGYKFENGNIIAVTNWMLTIYLLLNYCRWGWSYMNKSLFFLLGGTILLSLGLFLEKKRKSIIMKEGN